MAEKAKGRALRDTDYLALAEFRHQLRQFLMFSEQAARKAGLAPQQHQALLAIKGFGNVTMGDLAGKLGIRPHSAVELVNRLETARLVRRTPDAQDGRRVYLSLTPAAERRLESLTMAHREELKQLAHLWGPLFDALKG